MFIIRAAISVSFLSRKAVGENGVTREGVVVVEGDFNLKVLWIEIANRYPLQVPNYEQPARPRPPKTSPEVGTASQNPNCTNRLSKTRNRKSEMPLLY